MSQLFFGSSTRDRAGRQFGALTRYTTGQCLQRRAIDTQDLADEYAAASYPRRPNSKQSRRSDGLARQLRQELHQRQYLHSVDQLPARSQENHDLSFDARRPVPERSNRP